MKQNFLIIFLFIINISNAQEKISHSFVKSDTPIEIKPKLNIDLKIDSTTVSKKVLRKITEIDSLSSSNFTDKVNKELQLLINENPKNFYVICYVSIYQLNLGKEKEATSNFEKALNLTNDNKIKSSIKYLLSILDIRKGYSFLGIIKLKESIKLDPSNLTALIVMGILNDQQKNLNEAITYYERALNINPNLNNIWNNLGFIYQLKENHEKAIKIFDRIIKLEPKSPLPYSNRAFSKLKTHKVNSALIDINRSIELFPENSYAYKNRALIFLETNKTNDACSDLETSIKKGFVEKYGNEVIELQNRYCK